MFLSFLYPGHGIYLTVHIIKYNSFKKLFGKDIHIHSATNGERLFLNYSQPLPQYSQHSTLSLIFPF